MASPTTQRLTAALTAAAMSFSALSLTSCGRGDKPAANPPQAEAAIVPNYTLGDVAVDMGKIGKSTTSGALLAVLQSHPDKANIIGEEFIGRVIANAGVHNIPLGYVHNPSNNTTRLWPQSDVRPGENIVFSMTAVQAVYHLGGSKQIKSQGQDLSAELTPHIERQAEYGKLQFKTAMIAVVDSQYQDIFKRHNLSFTAVTFDSSPNMTAFLGKSLRAHLSGNSSEKDAQLKAIGNLYLAGTPGVDFEHVYKGLKLNGPDLPQLAKILASPKKAEAFMSDLYGFLEAKGDLRVFAPDYTPVPPSTAYATKNLEK